MDRKAAEASSEDYAARSSEKSKGDEQSKLFEDAYEGSVERQRYTGADNLQLASLVLDSSKEKSQFQIRESGSYGFGALALNFKQMERAIGRLDPEIWESPNMSDSDKQKVSNLRQLARDLKEGKLGHPLMGAIKLGVPGSEKESKEFTEKYPEGMIQKINSFLIGESANEIMKQSLANGSADRFSRPGRLLEEAVLAVKLGRIPSQAEYDKHFASVQESVNEIRKQYPPVREWTEKDHELIRKKSDEQLNTSEHWSKQFGSPTNKGLLACAAFITNGKVAGAAEKGVIPSLDLNMNGVVGEALIRGFNPRRIDDAIAEGQKARIKEPMALLIRPPRVSGDFKSERAGHIGFINTESGAVSHNNSLTGMGKKEAASASGSFKPEDKPYVLVPPGWMRITR